MIDESEDALTSEFGTEVKIEVDMRRASSFAKFEKETNRFIINGNNVTRDYIGTWKIQVKASYTDPKGRVQTF